MLLYNKLFSRIFNKGVVVICFFLKTFIYFHLYWKGREKQFVLWIALPTCPQQPGLDQAEMRSWEHDPGVLPGSRNTDRQGPSRSSRPLLSLRMAVTRKLELEKVLGHFDVGHVGPGQWLKPCATCLPNGGSSPCCSGGSNGSKAPRGASCWG